MDGHKGKPVLLTGHSLGGALAQIASIDIANYAQSSGNNAMVYLYDFGAPRWGNLKMIKYFEECIGRNEGYQYRIVNKADPVPKLPTRHSFQGWHHAGTEIHYTSIDPLKYIQCDGSGEDSRCRYHLIRIPDHTEYLGVDKHPGN